MSKYTETVVREIPVTPCVQCGQSDIQVNNPGYSSFNVGSVECKSCGYKVHVSGGDTDKEFIGVWNVERERLMAERARLLLRVSAIDVLLENSDAS